MMLEKLESCPDCETKSGYGFGYDSQQCSRCGWSAFGESASLEAENKRLRAALESVRQWCEGLTAGEGGERNPHAVVLAIEDIVGAALADSETTPEDG